MRTGRVHGRHTAALKPWNQVLREAGYRVHLERRLTNTHLAVHPHDQRRMDLVAAPGSRGLGARRGQALFCDVTVVSPLTRNGAPAPGARTTDGAALRSAERRKHRTYQHVSQAGAATLLVFGSEVYGRWSADAHDLVQEIVALKAAQAQPLLRGAAAAAWITRWWNVLSVGLQRAASEALLYCSSTDLLPRTTTGEEPHLGDVPDEHEA